MRRREFVGLINGVVATWPFAVLAQQHGRPRRIALLMNLPENDEWSKRAETQRE
jgi:hypothetical protein